MKKWAAAFFPKSECPIPGLTPEELAAAPTPAYGISTGFGAPINTTEGRAVLHTALRLPDDASLTVDGQDVVTEDTLKSMDISNSTTALGIATGIAARKIATNTARPAFASARSASTRSTSCRGP